MFHQRCERLIFKPLPKVDRLTIDSVYHVSEFCQSIQQNMLKVEKNWAIDYAYMDYQIKIDETTRSTLIDWLIKIHYNFKLLPESLFLTINIIDRYFSSRQI
jgi:G2/mitotic-specific cyclin 1/2